MNKVLPILALTVLPFVSQTETYLVADKFYDKFKLIME